MQVINYCERGDYSFWSEPLNALTNIAFLLAGLIAIRQQKKLSLLPVLMILIAIGSFLFHTLATRWAMFADVLPIYIFKLSFIYLYCRQVLNHNLYKVIAVFVLFFLSFYLLSFSPYSFNGSISYFPALFLMFYFLISHASQYKRTDRYLSIATVLFILSLIFRSIDYTLCQQLKIGTHFLWHCFNAGVLYLCWLRLFDLQTAELNKH